MSIPDLIEPFVGWKGLHANEYGQLFSPQVRERSDWPAAAPFEATCSENAKHQPPTKKCTCGIYAVKSFEALRDSGYNWDAEYHDPERGDCIAVVAEVRLYGRIREGRIGYRAEFAYPAKVYIPAWRLALGSLIRQRYGCSLGIIDRFTGERR